MSLKKHTRKEKVKPSSPLLAQEDNIQVQKMCLEEMHEENLMNKHNKQHPAQPEYIYYVWQSFFEQRKKIIFLREENERKTAEVDKLFSQLLEKEDIQKEKEMELLDMRGRNFELKAKLDKAIEKLKEILQQKKNEKDKDKKDRELQLKLDEALQKNTEILQEKKRQDIELQNLGIKYKALLQEKKQQPIKQKESKLEDSEENYRELKTKLDKALQRNNQILQEKEQLERNQRDMRCQLQSMEEKCRVLEAKLDKTAVHKQKYQELLQEKIQQDIKQKEDKRLLQGFERENQKLQELCKKMNYKAAEMEGEKEKLRKQCSAMQSQLNDMLTKNTKLEELSNTLKCKNTEVQVIKQQLQKTNEDLQCKLQEMERKSQQLEDTHNKLQERYTEMQEAKVMQEATSNELKERLEDKQAELEEVEKTCRRLEKDNTETIDQLRNLILEKKVLVEKLLEKKKKRFRFFWRKDTHALSGFSTADVTSSSSTSVPS
ncbi:trichohyalin-like [Oreochromis niloticus]|uniref:trichohyalin-like n=1 Tax=Oreochromis niloticus TaxID=8128 RepID=UPI0009055FCB|nr:trichohyalin-like [Oreochromis niloticus]XP_019211540.1 trichohyalin-like [Oreochromis niloticus]XP_019211541.1 trichohyalin-like [Oreochromis niloticus]XP_025760192.1 trichohyalin-like [Oreochromis niloticus]CAI5685889.1 unnamed protein product [Mustela putorius furo]